MGCSTFTVLSGCSSVKERTVSTRAMSPTTGISSTACAKAGLTLTLTPKTTTTAAAAPATLSHFI